MRVDIQPGILLTDETAGARHGLPVVHRTEDGREFGPGDPVPGPSPIDAVYDEGEPKLRTWADVVRAWRDYAGRTPEEIAAADAFLSQLPPQE